MFIPRHLLFLFPLLFLSPHIPAPPQIYFSKFLLPTHLCSLLTSAYSIFPLPHNSVPSSPWLPYTHCFQFFCILQIPSSLSCPPLSFCSLYIPSLTLLLHHFPSFKSPTFLLFPTSLTLFVPLHISVPFPLLSPSLSLFSVDIFSVSSFLPHFCCPFLLLLYSLPFTRVTSVSLFNLTLPAPYYNQNTCSTLHTSRLDFLISPPPTKHILLQCTSVSYVYYPILLFSLLLPLPLPLFAFVSAQPLHLFLLPHFFSLNFFSLTHLLSSHTFGRLHYLHPMPLFPTFCCSHTFAFFHTSISSPPAFFIFPLSHFFSHRSSSSRCDNPHTLGPLTLHTFPLTVRFPSHFCLLLTLLLPLTLLFSHI
ncbi:uncharacterized protein LOC119569476 [Penaeus monodon]|uniref:uncharacterized protein LOC119569476 n=1 Tax=Penaeus monodon TaxID=6687 RepID=UPI0018A6E638|nr:uncharacterized protein LOC119569476 [Penaeus monodon]